MEDVGDQHHVVTNNMAKPVTNISDCTNIDVAYVTKLVTSIGFVIIACTIP